ncbi:MAG: YvcK family protein [Candidatus Omnitrophica bacterium]|nr:YvcK family protein [Candidatus Omnitrophota bacterium]MCG2704795.1 YvcK family protein [Candidatus Omnitrophota bacterium]
MKILKWLIPGMGVKRWAALVVLSVVLISMGTVIMVINRDANNKAAVSVVILFGIIGLIVAIKNIVKSVVTVFLPQREEELVDIVYQKRYLERGSNIVTIGGGTGLSVLLHGLKSYSSNITAIVTVADDGGSSGRLRQEFNMLPPGDIRSCLVALADAEPLMRKLFQFRFEEGDYLKGHSFGNLFITAMSKVTGDFEEAIKQSSKVLAIRGKVIPSTLSKIKLVAEHKNGELTAGESKISETKNPIKRVFLEPDNCEATEEALIAVKEADVIILGPGSLYTSIIPNLLISGIYQEVSRSKVLKVYICNVMTQPGETDGYKASDHLKALINHSTPGIVNTCIINTGNVPEALLKKYKEEGAGIVEPDRETIQKMGYQVVGANIISATDYVRHNADKLSRLIMNLVGEGTRRGAGEKWL